MVRDENGRIDGVRYDELAPMLLNEVQKQQRKIDLQEHVNAAQVAEIRDLRQNEQQKIAAQDAQINQLKQQLAEIRVALVTSPNKDQLVAQR